MAQKTQLQALGTPGRVRMFTAKEAFLLPVGKVTATFSAAQPAISASAAQPAIAFSATRPEIIFEVP